MKLIKTLCGFLLITATCASWLEGKNGKRTRYAAEIEEPTLKENVNSTERTDFFDVTKFKDICRSFSLDTLKTIHKKIWAVSAGNIRIELLDKIIQEKEHPEQIKTVCKTVLGMGVALILFQLLCFIARKYGYAENGMVADSRWEKILQWLAAYDITNATHYKTLLTFEFVALVWAYAAAFYYDAEWNDDLARRV